MDGVDQAIQILVTGADQGATKAVALGTTAAAVAMWGRIRTHFRGKEAELDPELHHTLVSDPGDEVDPIALRHLLELVPESSKGFIVYGDYVARDKNVFNFDTR